MTRGTDTTLPNATAAEALRVERAYWEHHEDYDWSADDSKRQAFAQIPRLDGDVLELCVGAGAFTRAIPQTYSSYTGLDLSGSLLQALRDRLPRVAGVQGDAQRLPFADGSFDSILIFSGLHHLPDYEASIAEVYRVLRPGGCFFCFEPNDRAWYRAPMRLLRTRKFIRNLIRIYSEDEVYLDPRAVARALEQRGLVDIRVSFMTPRFRPGFLNLPTRVFAVMMYGAGALGNSLNTQSYFGLSARRP